MDGGCLVLNGRLDFFLKIDIRPCSTLDLQIFSQSDKVQKIFLFNFALKLKLITYLDPGTPEKLVCAT